MTELIDDPPIRLEHRILVGTRTGMRELGGDENTHDVGHIVSMAVGPDGAVLLTDDGAIRLASADGTHEIARVDDVRARVLATSGTDVLVGGAEATLLRVRGSEVRRITAFDTAPSRDAWYTPWGGPPDVFSIAVGHGDIYVNVHVGGILRSPDGGASWVPTIDLHDDVHDVVVDGSGTVWAATGRRGLARSTDRGASWEYLADELHSPYALGVAATTDGAVVCASSGPGRRDGKLYRLDGERLVPSADGLPDDLGGTVGGGRLSSVGGEVAMAAPDGAVYVSADGGRHWIQATGDIGATCVALR